MELLTVYNKADCFFSFLLVFTPASYIDNTQNTNLDIYTFSTMILFVGIDNPSTQFVSHSKSDHVLSIILRLTEIIRT